MVIRLLSYAVKTAIKFELVYCTTSATIAEVTCYRHQLQ